MIRVSRLLDLCFFGIILIVFGNFNGIFFLFTDIAAAFSSFILFFCLVICYYLFRYKKLTFPHQALNFCIISMLVIGSCTWFIFEHVHSEYTDYYRVFRKHAPGIILLYAIYKYLVYAADKNKLLTSLAIIALVLVLVTLITPLSVLTNIFTGVLSPLASGGGRANGLFANPNLAGVHVSFTMAFVLFFILKSKRIIPYLFFVGMLPLTLYAGVLTFSKAAIITQVLLLLLFLFYNIFFFMKNNRTSRRNFVTFIIIVAAGIIYSLPQIKAAASTLSFQQAERLLQIAQLAQGQLDEDTTTDRSLIWNEAIGMIKANPILGYGTSSFNNLPVHKLGAHNTYLMVWGEGGIIPFAALLIFIFSSYYRSYFWIVDPPYRFLSLSLLVVVTIQMYGAAHNGLNNSEVLCATAVVFAVIEINKGRQPEYRDVVEKKG